MPILEDDEFRTDHEIDFGHPANAYTNKEQSIYVYSLTKETIVNRVKTGQYQHKINVEFFQTDDENNSSRADFYFHPEDLERLGVLLQYEAKKYMQLRDEAIAAKLASEQQQKKQPRKGSILR